MLYDQDFSHYRKCDITDNAHRDKCCETPPNPISSKFKALNCLRCVKFIALMFSY